MLIRISGIEVSELGGEAVSFLTYLHSMALQGELFPLIGLVGFAVAISSIMLSTVDTSVLTIMQMWETDLIKKDETRVWFRLVMAIILFIVILFFAYLNKELESAQILVLVNGAYAQLFALSLPALIRLIRIKVSNFEIILSILFGTTFTWLAVFFAPAPIHYNITLVLPTFACFVGSILPFGYRLIKMERI